MPARKINRKSDTLDVSQHYSPNDIAKILHISHETARRYVRAGEHKKIGRNLRVNEKRFREILEGQI